MHARSSVEVWAKNILYRFTEGQTHFILPIKFKNEFGPELLKKVALHDSIHTLPPSMYHMWKDIVDIVCKATNAGNS